MSPSDPVKPFVEQYVKLVSDADYLELQNVLEMKGVKKVEQSQYLEIFKTLAPNAELKTSPRNIASNESFAENSSVEPQSRLAIGGDESRIKKLERLIKTFK